MSKRAAPGKDTRSENEEDILRGQLLRAARLAAGFSAEKLAERIGVTFQQIQKYETGRAHIPAQRAKAISVALKLPADWLSREPNNENLTLDTQVYASLRECAELLRLFNEIHNPVVRRHVVSLVRNLVDTDNEQSSL